MELHSERVMKPREYKVSVEKGKPLKQRKKDQKTDMEEDRNLSPRAHHFNNYQYVVNSIGIFNP